jgi:putative flippase GtrA
MGFRGGKRGGRAGAGQRSQARRAVELAFTICQGLPHKYSGGINHPRGRSQPMTATNESTGRGGAGLWPSSANRPVSNPLGRLSLAGQFLRYLLCAGLAALVNFLAGSLFVDGLGFTSAWEFPVAVAAAYTLGMVVNFLLNRNYTFASDRRGIDQARTFVVVALSGLALTTCVASLARPALALLDGGTFAFLSAPFGTPETLSRVLAIALASVYSFTAHKHFTFNRGIRLPLLRLMRSLQLGG